MDVIDPICGMTVESTNAPATRTTTEGTVFFCSAACAAEFDRRHATERGGVVRPAVALARTRRRAGRIMGALLVVAGLLLVVLLLSGLGEGAVAIAAGALLLSCLAACTVAGLARRKSVREVENAVADLAHRRREQSALRR